MYICSVREQTKVCHSLTFEENGAKRIHCSKLKSLATNLRNPHFSETKPSTSFGHFTMPLVILYDIETNCPLLKRNEETYHFGVTLIVFVSQQVGPFR